MVDLKAQEAFVNRLREGFVLTLDNIKKSYETNYPNRFVDSVRSRTGLDIRKGKLSIYSYSCPIEVVFLASDIRPEVAGLEFVQNAVEGATSEELPEVEYVDGHYLMWSCPNYLATTDGNYDYCGQFHKVDLGDEELDRPRTVHCVKCGKSYTVKPR